MKRYLPTVALLLFVAEVLLTLVSGIMSAASPTGSVRSMLSSEGIRWFLGHFVDIMASPLLVWLLLLAMAYGCIAKGVDLRANSYRINRARLFALVFLLLYSGIIIMLTMMPHAILLSASGSLWPSPFSASLVPVVSFGVMAAAIICGTVSGRFTSLGDVYEALLYGIRKAASLLLFYVLVAQLYFSLCFVFPIS